MAALIALVSSVTPSPISVLDMLVGITRETHSVEHTPCSVILHIAKDCISRAGEGGITTIYS